MASPGVPSMLRLSLARSFALAAGLVLGGATVARAEVIWRGDFSTGDLSQWSSKEAVSSDRLTVVPDPVDGSRDVLKAFVVQGDNPIHSSGNRNELLYTGDDVTGQERWYHWQTRWPADYASEPTWQVFTQWHQDTGGGSPPVEFFVNGETVYLRVQRDNPNGAVWTAPLERGRWHDFVFHVKWSSDPAAGWVELWYDGRLALPRHACATMFPGTGVYLKQGLYRSASISPTQTIFHTGMVVGTTLDDVVPPPAPSATASTASSTTSSRATPDGPAAQTTLVSPGSASPSPPGGLPAGQAGCDEAGWSIVALPFALGLLALGRRRRGKAGTV